MSFSLRNTFTRPEPQQLQPIRLQPEAKLLLGELARLTKEGVAADSIDEKLEEFMLTPPYQAEVAHRQRILKLDLGM